jgi:hypothetical protein
MIAKSIERITEENPQLKREWQGRLTPRNLTIATAISLVGQTLVYLYFRDRLPINANFNRYCTGQPPEGLYPEYYKHIGNTFCIQDLNGQWMIVHELWWLDIFTTLSIIGIFALLVVGTYQLIADLSSEERQGTLNFIRLAPRSAREIFTGKMLGVPVLLYWVAILALPLHLVAGLSAGIPLSLILAFYGVLAAACALFYSTSIAFALGSRQLGGFQAWLGSGIVLLFLFYSSLLILSGYVFSGTPFDWLTLFNPAFVLPYLVKATFLPPDAVGYLGISALNNLRWYGQNLWQSSIAGIGFILLNFGIWTYWITKILGRRFHNPLATIISKSHSYGITACFCLLILGFVVQSLESSYIFDNFTILIVFLAVFCLFLTLALTPSRQAVQDWARYRHQNGEKGKDGLKSLLWSEKSPATVAIAVNLAIVICAWVPAVLLSPLDRFQLPTLAGLLLGCNMLLLYAAIAQWVMLWKNGKRGLMAAATIAILITFPLFCLGLWTIAPNEAPLLWSFTALPILAARDATAGSIAFAVFGQWLGLTLLALQIRRQVRQIGASATKALLSGQKA